MTINSKEGGIADATRGFSQMKGVKAGEMSNAKTTLARPLRYRVGAPP